MSAFRAAPDMASRLMRQGAARPRAAAILAGMLAATAQSPLHIWPAMFLALPALIWLLDLACRAKDGAGGACPQQSPASGRNQSKQAAWLGWSFGFGYFFIGLYWISAALLVDVWSYGWLLPLSLTLIPGFLGLFFALACAVAGYFWRPGLSRILTLALALALSEWLRGHLFTGFPWNTLGYSLLGNDALLQLSSVLGPYALTLLAALIFAAPAVYLAPRGMAAPPPQAAARHPMLAARWRPPALAFALIGLLMLLGALRLALSPTAYHEDVRVRAAQPNIAQRDKWRPDKVRENLDKLLAVSALDGQGEKDDMRGVDLLVWPESVFPFIYAETPAAQKLLADRLPEGLILLTGALHRTPPERTGEKARLYNALIVIDGEGRLRNAFPKRHLVPFGEYLPFQNLMNRIGLRQIVNGPGGFSAGTSPRRLALPRGLPAVGPLICYEVAFPGEVVDKDHRSDWLANTTNDGWYGYSSGPFQHFHQARIRAAEQGLPLVRSANTGISGIIDPYGRVLKKLGLEQSGSVESRLPRPLDGTIYSRYGSIIFVTFWMITFICNLLLGRKPA